MRSAVMSSPTEWAYCRFRRMVLRASTSATTIDSAVCCRAAFNKTSRVHSLSVCSPPPPEGDHSHVFAGQNVGVAQVGDRIWLVTFMDYDLGYFDDETCRLEPIENPFGPKV